MGDNEDDEMDNALSWDAEDRVAYERSKASNAGMLRDGVPELIFQWARQEGMAQKQQALKIGFVFSLVPQCMGPTPQFNDA